MQQESLYKVLMMFMEGRAGIDGAVSGDVLTVKINEPAPEPGELGPLEVATPPKFRRLSFRRQRTMSGGATHVTSVEYPHLRINYDPAWENQDTVARILRGGK